MQYIAVSGGGNSISPKDTVRVDNDKSKAGEISGYRRTAMHATFYTTVHPPLVQAWYDTKVANLRGRYESH